MELLSLQKIVELKCFRCLSPPVKDYPRTDCPLKQIPTHAPPIASIARIHKNSYHSEETFDFDVKRVSPLVQTTGFISFSLTVSGKTFSHYPLRVKTGVNRVRERHPKNGT